MEMSNNQLFEVIYKLYAKDNEGTEMVEEATREQPFQFISGMGFALEAFESEVMPLEKGMSFDFTIDRDNAYGDIDPEKIVDVSRDIFAVNGHFDHDNVFKGAILPLINEEGERFYGKVLSVGDEQVKMDFNHPLAGKALTFAGEVVEKREATQEEINALLAQMSGEGCGCGSCNCDDASEGGCGCGCGCGC